MASENATTLLEKCTDNVRQYLLGNPSNVESCHRLIQMAFETNNESAWNACYTMLAWRTRMALSSHSLMAQIGEDVEYFVNLCIARFWAGIRLKHDQFDSAPAYFSYLRMCVNSELVEYWRKCKDESDIDDLQETPKTVANCTAEEIMMIIMTEISDPDLQLLCELYYCFAMKPSEILSCYPNKWTTVKKVYYHVYELNKRLRHHPDLLDCLGITNR